MHQRSKLDFLVFKAVTDIGFYETWQPLTTYYSRCMAATKQVSNPNAYVLSFPTNHWMLLVRGDKKECCYDIMTQGKFLLNITQRTGVAKHAARMSLDAAEVCHLHLLCKLQIQLSEEEASVIA